MSRNVGNHINMMSCRCHMTWHSVTSNIIHDAFRNHMTWHMTLWSPPPTSYMMWFVIIWHDIWHCEACLQHHMSCHMTSTWCHMMLWSLPPTSYVMSYVVNMMSYGPNMTWLWRWGGPQNEVIWNHMKAHMNHIWCWSRPKWHHMKSYVRASHVVMNAVLYHFQYQNLL